MPETLGIAWALVKWLGIPVIFISYLTALKVHLLEINFDEIPAPYKSLMYFVSSVSICVIAWERYQKGRKMKIENDHQEWENMQKRGKKIKENEKQ